MKIEMLDKDAEKVILAAERNEITEYFIYENINNRIMLIINNLEISQEAKIFSLFVAIFHMI
jgi:hypothetical protein